MKAMSLEELNSIRTRRTRESYSMKAAKVLREFVESGYEACEVEPKDMGALAFTKSRLGYICKVINQQAIALKLDKIAFSETHGEKLCLVRIDI